VPVPETPPFSGLFLGYPSQRYPLLISEPHGSWCWWSILRLGLSTFFLSQINNAHSLPVPDLHCPPLHGGPNRAGAKGRLTNFVQEPTIFASQILRLAFNLTPIVVAISIPHTHTHTHSRPGLSKPHSCLIFRDPKSQDAQLYPNLSGVSGTPWSFVGRSGVLSTERIAG
jgi:hypothetical protein